VSTGITAGENKTRRRGRARGLKLSTSGPAVEANAKLRKQRTYDVQQRTCTKEAGKLGQHSEMQENAGTDDPGRSWSAALAGRNTINSIRSTEENDTSGRTASPRSTASGTAIRARLERRFFSADM